MGKIAVITGASRGIGAAAARILAENGYDLALSCRKNMEMLQTLAGDLEKNYRTRSFCFCGDMGDYRQAGEFISKAQEDLGPADVLINNAGVSWIGLLTDMTARDWDEVIRSNLTSVFNCCHEVIPAMVHRKSGRIINISSVWGCCGASCEAAYSASKGGVNALTQALAKELAPSGISVNAIACGTIDTSMNAFLSPQERQTLEEEIPAGRFARPEEVGDTILSLCNTTTYLTGQIIRLDGGWI